MLLLGKTPLNDSPFVLVRSRREGCSSLLPLSLQQVDLGCSFSPKPVKIICHEFTKIDLLSKEMGS